MLLKQTGGMRTTRAPLEIDGSCAAWVERMTTTIERKGASRQVTTLSGNADRAAPASLLSRL